MNHKLFTFFSLLALAMLLVLLDFKEALALPLDPSEIKVGQIVRTTYEWVQANPGKVVGGGAAATATELVLKPVRRIFWMLADGTITPKK